VAGLLTNVRSEGGGTVIDTIIVITALFGVLVGVAFLAIRSQGNDTIKNDVVEQDRKALPFVSVARAFDRECEIVGNDAFDDDVEEQRDTFTAFSVAQAFDRDCAIIWSTQVPALELVDNAGRNGVPVKQLYPFYTRGVRRYPELYEGSSFGSWLEFLEREKLVTRSGLQVLITRDGHKFLQYRLVPESIPAA
jgi:hypothetical protein